MKTKLTAKDLMVGDWVRVGEDGLCIPKGTIVKIRAINELDYLVLKSGKRLTGSAHCQPTEENVFSGGIWVDYLEPIPLTAEILEKNGFQRCENEWYYFKYGKNGKVPLYQVLWNADELYLEIASYTSLTGEFNRMGVRFVHELMHALKLCGIDKTIES